MCTEGLCNPAGMEITSSWKLKPNQVKYRVKHLFLALEQIPRAQEETGWRLHPEILSSPLPPLHQTPLRPGPEDRGWLGGREYPLEGKPTVQTQQLTMRSTQLLNSVIHRDKEFRGIYFCLLLENGQAQEGDFRM